jgi:ketosteroid isomerase-like protein
LPTDFEQQIKANEERLRLAMLASDLDVLDELISSDLIFTNHLGQVYGKQDDLGLHRSGVLKFYTLEPTELQVKACGQLFVVSVRVKLSGAYGGSQFATDMRYTRIWRPSTDGSWQIVVGHSSAIV